MKPRWNSRIPWILVYHAAEKYKLAPELIAAVIMTESSGKPDAFRFEQGYRWLYQVSENAARIQIPVDAEEYFQSCSWGLMQIMGATCRQLGYKDSLEHMIQPELNIEYGCKYLAMLLKRYKGDWDDAVAAYNAGSVIKNRR